MCVCVCALRVRSNIPPTNMLIKFYINYGQTSCSLSNSCSVAEWVLISCRRRPRHAADPWCSSCSDSVPSRLAKASTRALETRLRRLINMSDMALTAMGTSP